MHINFYMLVRLFVKRSIFICAFIILLYVYTSNANIHSAGVRLCNLHDGYIVICFLCHSWLCAVAK